MVERNSLLHRGKLTLTESIHTEVIHHPLKIAVHTRNAHIGKVPINIYN